MASPSISFTDDVGAVTITALLPRLNNWVPDVDVIGPNDTALGTGALFQWEFRRDYWASFEMPCIPAASLGDLARLKAWLAGGGSATLATNDLAARTYTVTQKPGTTLSWELDRQTLEYTLKASVRNSGGTVMLCVYR